MFNKLSDEQRAEFEEQMKATVGFFKLGPEEAVVLKQVALRWFIAGAESAGKDVVRIARGHMEDAQRRFIEIERQFERPKGEEG